MILKDANPGRYPGQGTKRIKRVHRFAPKGDPAG